MKQREQQERAVNKPRMRVEFAAAIIVCRGKHPIPGDSKASDIASRRAKMTLQPISSTSGHRWNEEDQIEDVKTRTD